ncbi:hypothetical protein CAEBREN_05529 [Caenorhabditis brenneri]|uniref:Uncharacterized protein n=1 Tax=Caenorhabditis brenneri TaxID=135651 RepID=G0MJ91_CAEBE|nr:hypothetical protein CAEBREN_05529 [Caenorhabditis brenneri]
MKGRKFSLLNLLILPIYQEKLI